MPLIPLGLAGYLAFGMWLLTDEKFTSCDPERGAINSFQGWLCEQYCLDLQEKLLTRGTPSPSIVNRLRGVSFTTAGTAKSDSSSDAAKQREQSLVERRNKALDDVLVLDLRNRSFRGAKFYKAVLPKADFRNAKLQGADLTGAQLQGADLYGVDLEWADLTGADFSFAYIIFTKNLETAELAGADFVFADGLEGTFLDINQPPPDLLAAP